MNALVTLNHVLNQGFAIADYEAEAHLCSTRLLPTVGACCTRFREQYARAYELTSGHIEPES